MTLRERVEGGRRAKAALAYAGRTAKDVASTLNMSEPTFRRVLAGTRRETDWADFWAIADACTLPRSLFSVDLTRLDEIVGPGQPMFARRPELFAEMERELEERVRRARRRTGADESSKRGPRGGGSAP